MKFSSALIVTFLAFLYVIIFLNLGLSKCVPFLYEETKVRNLNILIGFTTLTSRSPSSLSEYGAHLYAPPTYFPFETVDNKILLSRY